MWGGGRGSGERVEGSWLSQPDNKVKVHSSVLSVISLQNDKRAVVQYCMKGADSTSKMRITYCPLATYKVHKVLDCRVKCSSQDRHQIKPYCRY